MNKSITILKLSAILLVGSATAYAFSSGPPASHTGAPGESNCTQCHIGNPLNSGGGSIEIVGVPAQYTPGEEVTLTVRVKHPDRRRWGFQLTALDSSNRPAGIFTVIDRNTTRLVSGSGELSGRSYVEHTEPGTFAGQTQGEWQVKWTATGTDVGRITFYAAGNAANNNAGSSGDNIYTTSVGSGTVSPSVIAPSYKKGKIVLQENGSNIVAGAMLEVTPAGASQAESFVLSANKTGTKWQVKSSARSTPGNLTVNQVFPAGTTVTLVVKNPDGRVSQPVTLSR